MEQVKSNGDKLKSTIRGESNINMRYEREYAMYGFSWPQRSYKCTFCKKEFKSAQALGGHMNVHRRDRARLRQSPPSWDCPINPNPNNPNFLSSSSSSPSSSFSLSSSSSSLPAVRFLPYPTNYNFSLTSLTLTSPADQEMVPVPLIARSGCDYVGPQLGDVRKKLSMRSSAPSTFVDAAAGDDHFKDIPAQENRSRKDQREIVRLQGMEMDVGLFIDAKEGLDLELRLGQSN